MKKCSLDKPKTKQQRDNMGNTNNTTNNNISDLSSLSVEALRAALAASRNREKQEMAKREEEMRDKLSNLHAQYGFSDPNEFISILRKIHRGPVKSRIKPEVIARVEELITKGEKPLAIALECDVSEGFVNGRKKMMGLTKPRAASSV